MMAIVGSAKKMPRDRSGGDDLLSGGKRALRVYRVDTDDKTDDQDVVLNASGLPRLGDPYVGNLGSPVDLKVVRRTADQAPNLWYLWYVTIEYSTDNVDPNDPINEPAEFKISWESYKETLWGTARIIAPSSGGFGFVSKYEKGITNAAGEPFSNPPYEVGRTLPVVTFARNEPLTYVTMARLMEFENTVNKTTWSGLEARVAFCRGIEPVYVERAREGNSPPFKYFRTTYTWALKRETWDLQLLNEGTYYLDSNLQKKTERDADGNLKKVILTKYGDKFVSGTTPEEERWLRWPRPALAASGNYPAVPAQPGVHYESDFNLLGINFNLWLGNPKTPQPPPAS